MFSRLFCRLKPSSFRPKRNYFTASCPRFLPVSALRGEPLENLVDKQLGY
jgi:hypothetical protein